MRWAAGVVGCVCVAAAAAASPALDEAQALIDQGRLENALERLERQVSSAPQDAEARFMRGLVLVRLNRHDDAAKVFTALTRDFPQLPEPYNNLAVIYAQQGDYDKARQALEAALASHPSYSVAHENLGDIYAALSAAAYNRALTLDPANAALRAKLTLVSRLDGLARGAVATTAPAAPASAAAAAAPPAPVPAATDDDAIRQVLLDWAAAWSSQDVDKYLSFYAPDFTPDGGVSRQAWESLRRARVAKPRQISVRLSELRVTPQGPGRAQATFRQDYQSEALNHQSTKVLDLIRSGGRWLIRRETSR
jgi:tetratricopeptide (TPR) repeat protein